MTNWKVLTMIAFVVGIVGMSAIVSIYVVGQGYIPDDFGIVIDAGSSHSRMTLYRWQGDKFNQTGLVREMDYCEAKPGIGSIDVDKIDSYFETCLDKIIGVIENFNPKKLPPDPKQTPVYFGATAGLRLLNLTEPGKVSAILTQVSKTLSARSKLNVAQASIIDGSSEGLFAWITANHLLNKLRRGEPTFATLDMGGASAQIAYEVTGRNASENVTETRLYGHDRMVRASSNLCFGVDQARYRLYRMLQTSPTQQTLKNPCMPSGSTITVPQATLDGPCLLNKESDIMETIHGDRSNYTITGTSDPAECKDLVSKMLDIEECTKEFKTCFTTEHDSTIDSSTLLAFSTYYYTAKIFPLSDKKTTTHQAWLNLTEQFCKLDLEEALKFPNIDKPYVNEYCFQLYYVEQTLSKVYNLGTNWANVRFANKVGQQSLGWSLGYMINATNAIPAEAPVEPLIGTTFFAFLVVTLSLILICGIVFLLKCLQQGSNEVDIYEPIDPEF